MDATSTSGSLGVTPTDAKRNGGTALNVAIVALSLAKETTSFMPAKAAFSSTIILLNMIRVYFPVLYCDELLAHVY